MLSASVTPWRSWSHRVTKLGEVTKKIVKIRMPGDQKHGAKAGKASLEKSLLSTQGRRRPIKKVNPLDKHAAGERRNGVRWFKILL